MIRQWYYRLHWGVLKTMLAWWIVNAEPRIVIEVGTFMRDYGIKASKP